MRSSQNILLSLLFLLQLGWMDPAAAQADSDPYTPGAGRTVDLNSTNDLEGLVGPIALYPDKVLSTILPAATLPEQVAQAAQLVRSGRSSAVASADLDDAVKALAKIPDVLNFMSRQLDWTTRLGQAFVTQEADVLRAIQSLRAKAKELGNLPSTPEQTVIVEDRSIVIESPTPEVVYIPQYDPAVVYVNAAPPGNPFVAFATGVAVGAWFHYPCYWNHHYVPWAGWGRYGPVWANRGWGWPSVNVNNVNIAKINNVHNININNNHIRNDFRRYNGGNLPNTGRRDARSEFRRDLNNNRLGGPASGSVHAGPHGAVSGQPNAARSGEARERLRSSTERRSTSEMSQKVISGLHQGGSFERDRWSSGGGEAKRSSFESRSSSGGHSSRYHSEGAFGNYGSRAQTYTHSERGASSRSFSQPLSGGGFHGHAGGGGFRRR